MTEQEMADLLSKKGWGTIPPQEYLIDCESGFLHIWKQVKSYTMTSPERAYGLYKAAEYICRNRLPGDFVECGVWKGGSCMLLAYVLQEAGDKSRRIYLYDTFTGMPEPSCEDIIAWNDKPVLPKWRDRAFDGWSVGAASVRENLQTTGADTSLFVLVEGDVAETLKKTVPKEIALLRLDTDWYASTRTELEYLYPRLVQGGVLLIDDYGHFKGARKAVDEYFNDRNEPILLNRLDYTGRIGVKGSG